MERTRLDVFDDRFQIVVVLTRVSSWTSFTHCHTTIRPNTTRFILLHVSASESRSVVLLPPASIPPCLEWLDQACKLDELEGLEHVGCGYAFVLFGSRDLVRAM